MNKAKMVSDGMKMTYKTGKDFMDDLHRVYGLLEGCKLAEEYLEMQKDMKSRIERRFCAELKTALNELNML